ncbi:SRPBCC family protein [Streptomyces sp. NPDC056121]|uniref:SRPBCC family protein n=1 Tax=Streptomyces sp. NPDC056121 TaxID=3345718 RepID=UPI0035D71435
MKLHHTTTVQASPTEVWQFLQDTRAVVACLPGAELTDELENDRYGGVLRIAIGPLKMNYNGEVDVLRRDAQTRELEFAASGRDRRGGGSVRADVRVGVANAGNGTSQLESVTDLQLTGRIAALGRGVQDVSNTMFIDFSRRLADSIATGTAEDGQVRAATATAASPGAGPAPGGAAPVARQADHQASVSSEIKLTQLVVSVARQRLADMFARWSEKLRP